MKDPELNKRYKLDDDGNIRSLYRYHIVLGMINNVTQNFRVMLIPDRLKLILNFYLIKYIKEYNEIITDRYKSYSFLDADLLILKIDILLKNINDSLNKKKKKLHSKEQIEELNSLYSALTNIQNIVTRVENISIGLINSKFEFHHGLESSSHIEGLWGNLKSLIKSMYNQIQVTNLILF